MISIKKVNFKVIRALRPDFSNTAKRNWYNGLVGRFIAHRAGKDKQDAIEELVTYNERLIRSFSRGFALNRYPACDSEDAFDVMRTRLIQGLISDDFNGHFDILFCRKVFNLAKRDLHDQYGNGGVKRSYTSTLEDEKKGQGYTVAGLEECGEVSDDHKEPYHVIWGEMRKKLVYQTFATAKERGVLNDENANIIVEHVLYGRKLSDIAREMDLLANTLQKRINRLFKELQKIALEINPDARAFLAA